MSGAHSLLYHRVVEGRLQIRDLELGLFRVLRSAGQLCFDFLFENSVRRLNLLDVEEQFFLPLELLLISTPASQPLVLERLEKSLAKCIFRGCLRTTLVSSGGGASADSERFPLGERELIEGLLYLVKTVLVNGTKRLVSKCEGSFELLEEGLVRIHFIYNL